GGRARADPAAERGGRAVMMHWNSFGRSAGFAAVAALAWIPWLVLTVPIVGPPAARMVYLIVVTSAYVWGLDGPIPRRVGAALLTGAAGAAPAVAPRDPAVLCLVLGAALAVVRSVFLYPAVPARGVLTETALGGGGLLFACLLGPRSAFGAALPIWGFFLVQSCFFLFAGARAVRSRSDHPDPFEAAYAHAMEMLEPEPSRHRL